MLSQVPMIDGCVITSKPAVITFTKQDPYAFGSCPDEAELIPRGKFPTHFSSNAFMYFSC